MLPQHKKFLLIILALLAVTFILLGLVFWQKSDQLEVIFFDVGWGDSILIKTPQGQKVLIDGGPDNTVVYKLGEHLPFYDKTIDLMILTHPHSDHVMGLNEILKRYQVRQVLMTGVVHTTPDYLNWLKLIEEKNIKATVAQKGQSFSLGQVKIEILYPFQDLSHQIVENLNNTSIVAKLTYGQNSFLFMGDAEIEVEQDLIAAGIDLKTDVLKVGHHGRDTSTSQEFLEKVSPQIAVISVGEGRSFGRTSLRVLKRLERAGAKIFRTDLQGDIKITSDGKKLNIFD